MVVFPHCKINLGLNIIGKRSDGFHDIETVFYPIAFSDILEVISDPNLTELAFTTSGLPIPGDSSENLCVKAWHLLKADFPELQPVRMHLHKVIPMGAGLGGGSSNGVFALQLFNIKSRLKLGRTQLLSYAAALGSDCAFFTHKKPCFATGRGEILQPMELDLSNYQLVLVHPGIHVNTAWAFSRITPIRPEKAVGEIVLQPVETWAAELDNDFERPVFEAHPELAGIKKALYQQKALYAAMSGSGSTIFGIFDKNHTPSFDFPPHYMVKTLPLTKMY